MTELTPLSEHQEALLDQVIDAGMNLADLRKFKELMAEGDTSITPALFMAEKALSDDQRAENRARRMSEATNKDMAEFLNDKFPVEKPKKPGDKKEPFDDYLSSKFK